jgi:hypothetical protein
MKYLLFSIALLFGILSLTSCHISHTGTKIPSSSSSSSSSSTIFDPNSFNENKEKSQSVIGAILHRLPNQKQQQQQQQQLKTNTKKNIVLNNNNVAGESNGIDWTSDNNLTSAIPITMPPDFFTTNGRDLLLTRNIDTNQLFISWFVLLSLFALSVMFHILTAQISAHPVEIELRLSLDTTLTSEHASLKRMAYYTRQWSYISVLFAALAWPFLVFEEFTQSNAFFWSFFGASCMSLLTSMVRIIFTGWRRNAWTPLVYTLFLWLTISAFFIAMVFATLTRLWLLGLTIPYVAVLFIQGFVEIFITVYIADFEPIDSTPGSSSSSSDSTNQCSCKFRYYFCKKTKRRQQQNELAKKRNNAKQKQNIEPVTKKQK